MQGAVLLNDVPVKHSITWTWWWSPFLSLAVLEGIELKVTRT